MRRSLLPPTTRTKRALPISCRRGCAACCHQLVAVTVPEARRLEKAGRCHACRTPIAHPRALRRNRSSRQKSRSHRPALDGRPPRHGARSCQGRNRPLPRSRQSLQRHGAPCGFLENGDCSIYSDRPLICREYAVTSPAENCSHLSVEAIRRLEPPVVLSDGLAAVTAAIEQKPFEQIPLFAALAWAERPENQPPSPKYSGVDLLKSLARWIDANSSLPLEARSPNTNRA